MPRRTYDPKHGRRRPHSPALDWTWLLDLLRHERQTRRTQGRNTQ